MKTKILAVTREPVEMLNNVLRYVQLFLAVGVGLNLHPLALCLHLHSATIQQESKLCCFASWMAFKTWLGKMPPRTCLVEPYK